MPKKDWMASKKYFKHFFELIYLYSVHPRFAEGVESPTKFSKKGLDMISIFRGRLLEKTGWHFCTGGGRDRSFYMKNKLKSEILNNKNPANQNIYGELIKKGGLDNFQGTWQKIGRRVFFKGGEGWYLDAHSDLILVHAETWDRTCWCEWRWILINLSCILMQRKK